MATLQIQSTVNGDSVRLWIKATLELLTQPVVREENKWLNVIEESFK